MASNRFLRLVAGRTKGEEHLLAVAGAVLVSSLAAATLTLGMAIARDPTHPSEWFGAVFVWTFFVILPTAALLTFLALRIRLRTDAEASSRPAGTRA